MTSDNPIEAMTVGGPFDRDGSGIQAHNLPVSAVLIVALTVFPANRRGTVSKPSSETYSR